MEIVNYNDTKTYLQIKKEMCEQYEDCIECPFYRNNNKYGVSCAIYDEDYPDEAIADIKKWHRQNRSTYKKIFFRNFPNAQKDSDGYPKIYACLLYPQIRDKYSGDCSSCQKCWDMVEE